MPDILAVDDDAAFLKIVGDVLSSHDFAVTAVRSGKAAVKAAAEKRPDLVILDLVMPGLRGIEVCQKLKERPETAGIPILILTGNDREGQEIACLDMGADDYLTKPVKTERLLAHCRALLRRARGGKPSPSASVGPLRLDYPRKLAVLREREFPHLTPKEFELLWHLAERSPEPVDRAALYRQVWGAEPPSEGALKTVEVHVRRVRLKLGLKADELVRTVPGRGYCLAA